MLYMKTINYKLELNLTKNYLRKEIMTQYNLLVFMSNKKKTRSLFIRKRIFEDIVNSITRSHVQTLDLYSLNCHEQPIQKRT